MSAAWVLLCMVVVRLEPLSLAIPFEKITLQNNGLEVILHEDRRLPIVAISLWYHTGPAHEPPGRGGLAHLLEHMMFKGSRHLGDNEGSRLLDAVGATSANAITDYDQTHYFATVPSNQLERVLWMESDRMGFLLDAMTQKKLDKERQVVIQERYEAIESAPYGPSDEALVQALLPAPHPYHGFVIGSVLDLNAITLNDLSDFYRSGYAPSNATLVLAGDFERARVKALVAQYFGSLPHRQPPSPATYPTPRVQAERRITVEEPVSLARIEMGWLSPPYLQPGDAEADVIAAILGNGRSSRLYRRLVHTSERAQSVYASQESLSLGSILRVTVLAKPGVAIEPLRADIDTVLDTMRHRPPSSAEIERARNWLVTQHVASLEKLGGVGGKAEILNRYNHYVGDPGYLPRDVARYQRMTPESVHHWARKLLNPQRRVVVVTRPAASQAGVQTP